MEELRVRSIWPLQFTTYRGWSRCLTVLRKEVRNVMGPGIAEVMATVAAWGELDAWIAAIGEA